MEKLQQSVYTLGFFVLAFSGLYLAAPFLIPVALSAVFAMLFIRMCNFLESKGIKRAWAALYCVLLFVLCFGAIIGLLSLQLGSLSENIDPMKERLTGILESFRSWISATIGIKRSTQEKIMETGTSGSSGSMLWSFATSLLGILTNTILVIVYMYLFLSYRSHIKKFILKLVPQKENAQTTEIVHDSGKVAQKYLSGLAAMIALLWVMYGIGFTLIGIKGALFFAVLCGLLEIIPFVGNLTGTFLTLLAAIGQGGDGKMIIGVICTYLIVQFIQTYIIEPLVVGEQVNINPLFTIMAIVLGEMIWGVPGMILAVPLLGMTKIVCDNYPALKPYGFLLGPTEKRKRQTGLIDKLKKLFQNK